MIVARYIAAAVFAVAVAAAGAPVAKQVFQSHLPHLNSQIFGPR